MAKETDFIPNVVSDPNLVKKGAKASAEAAVKEFVRARDQALQRLAAVRDVSARGVPLIQKLLGLGDTPQQVRQFIASQIKPLIVQADRAVTDVIRQSKGLRGRAAIEQGSKAQLANFETLLGLEKDTLKNFDRETKQFLSQVEGRARRVKQALSKTKREQERSTLGKGAIKAEKDPDIAIAMAEVRERYRIGDKIAKSRKASKDRIERRNEREKEQEQKKLEKSREAELALGAKDVSKEDWKKLQEREKKQLEAEKDPEIAIEMSAVREKEREAKKQERDHAKRQRELNALARKIAQTTKKAAEIAAREEKDDAEQDPTIAALMREYREDEAHSRKLEKQVAREQEQEEKKEAKLKEKRKKDTEKSTAIVDEYAESQKTLFDQIIKFGEHRGPRYVKNLATSMGDLARAGKADPKTLETFFALARGTKIDASKTIARMLSEGQHPGAIRERISDIERQEREQKEKRGSWMDIAGRLTSQAFAGMGNQNIANALNTFISQRHSQGNLRAGVSGIGGGVLGFLSNSYQTAAQANEAVLGLANVVGGRQARSARRFDPKFGMSVEELAQLGTMYGRQVGTLDKKSMRTMQIAERMGVGGSFAGLMGGLVQSGSVGHSQSRRVLIDVISAAIHTGLKKGRWHELFEGMNQVVRSSPIGMRISSRSMGGMYGAFAGIRGFEGGRGMQALQLLNQAVMGGGGPVSEATSLMSAGLGSGKGFFEAWKTSKQESIFGKGGAKRLMDWYDTFSKLMPNRDMQTYMMHQMTGGKIAPKGLEGMLDVMEQMKKGEISPEESQKKIADMLEKNKSLDQKALEGMAGLLAVKSTILSWKAIMDDIGQKLIPAVIKIQQYLQKILNWIMGIGKYFGFDPESARKEAKIRRADEARRDVLNNVAANPDDPAARLAAIKAGVFVPSHITSRLLDSSTPFKNDQERLEWETYKRGMKTPTSPQQRTVIKPNGKAAKVVQSPLPTKVTP